MQFSSRDFSQKKGGNGANNATYLFLLLLLLPFPKNGNGEKHAGVFFSYFSILGCIYGENWGSNWIPRRPTPSTT